MDLFRQKRGRIAILVLAGSVHVMGTAALYQGKHHKEMPKWYKTAKNLGPMTRTKRGKKKGHDLLESA